MPVFSYRAADRDERVKQGTLKSESKFIARRMLREQGLRIISIDELTISPEGGTPNSNSLVEAREAERDTRGHGGRQRDRKYLDVSVEAGHVEDGQRHKAGFSPGQAQSASSAQKKSLSSNPRLTRSTLFRRRTSKAKIASFLSELSTLLTVGVPLIEALDTLIVQEKSKFSVDLMQLRDAVESGLTMREAMGMRPELFDELCLSLVEVGENTGRLDESLRSLAEFKRKSIEFRDRVKNALLYPLIILGLSVAASIFLMTSVVPSLLENLLDLGKQLPWPTRVLKFLSDNLLSYGWLMFAVGVTLITGCLYLQRTKRGRLVKDKLVVRTPVLGELSRKQEISRVALVIATLNSSGLDFLKSIEIASRTSHNLLLQEALDTIAERIRVGHDLGRAMDRLDYFPALVSQVFVVGQKSGRLDEMLHQLSADYDNQVTVLSNRLAVILEPVLIIFLSVVVGFILFATILPILEAGNVL